MDKKIIVKVAAGLGNQMFMYANALSLSNRFCNSYFIAEGIFCLLGLS